MIKIDKLFGDKKTSSLIYILLAMGIILLVFGNSSKKAPSQENSYEHVSRATEAEEILSQIEGAGKVSVMISQKEKEEKSLLGNSEKEEYSCGVLIVAEGGGDSGVREKLVRAASVALGVSAHKIEVFERK